MSDGIIYQKIRELIAQCEQIDMQNEIERAKLQNYLASRFRLTNSEIGSIIADMIQQDTIKKQNRFKIKIM